MARRREKAPLISVKTVGRLLRLFDEKAVDGFINRKVVGYFGKASEKVRETLHAGYLRNYTFVVLIGLLLLAIIALFLRK